MKATLNRMKLALFTASVAATEASTTTSNRMLRDAARIGMIAGVLSGGPTLASAQGFIKGFQNLGTLMQLGIGLFIAVGLLVGLGMILGGLFAMYKKYDGRGSDDNGWGKIAMQVCAGGLSMALGWVGVNIVETLGGSSSDIGKSVTR